MQEKARCFGAGFLICAKFGALIGGICGGVMGGVPAAAGMAFRSTGRRS